MKTKRTIELAVLMSAAVAFSYWLGYEQGSTSASLRLSAVSSRRVIAVGGGFPQGRNYLSDPFGVTGTITVPKEQKE
jgi:hypothetical protein